MTDTMNNDKIIDRDELQEAYVNAIIDGMDWKLWNVLYMIQSMKIWKCILMMN